MSKVYLPSHCFCFESSCYLNNLFTCMHTFITSPNIAKIITSFRVCTRSQIVQTLIIFFWLTFVILSVALVHMASGYTSTQFHRKLASFIKIFVVFLISNFCSNLTEIWQRYQYFFNTYCSSL